MFHILVKKLLQNIALPDYLGSQQFKDFKNIQESMVK